MTLLPLETQSSQNLRKDASSPGSPNKLCSAFPFNDVLETEMTYCVGRRRSNHKVCHSDRDRWPVFGITRLGLSRPRLTLRMAFCSAARRTPYCFLIHIFIWRRRWPWRATQVKRWGYTRSHFGLGYSRGLAVRGLTGRVAVSRQVTVKANQPLLWLVSYLV